MQRIDKNNIIKLSIIVDIIHVLYIIIPWHVGIWLG